ncbi:uncharacterized protein LOC119740675 [Patiria miniata]|uniref:G-protein coupled receptors family 1 profile domain-containing protein n=1 Tax=Patiria miniata TaxID=46514 RepID=A0A914B833_PATMI|nr:uncharacterized protein LOC119740675 [Patiria miniata]
MGFEAMKNGQILDGVMMTAAGIGLLGNLLVCITVVKVKHLHSLTNYLLLNLAVSDLMTCFIYLLTNILKQLGIPPADASITVWSHVFCRVMYSNYLFFSFSFVSVYNLVIISFERYVAIVYPLRYAEICTKRRVGVAICSAWGVGFLLYLIHFFGIYVDEGNAVSLYCTYGHSWAWHFIPFVFGFLFPLSAMLWAYYQIIKTLKMSARRQLLPGHAGELFDARRRVIRLMLLVTGVFVLLFGGTQPIQMIIVFTINDTYETTESAGTYACLLLYLFNEIPAMLTSILNPIIYAFKYKAFRRGMKEGLCPCLRGGLVSPTVSRVDSMAAQNNQSFNNTEYFQGTVNPFPGWLSILLLCCAVVGFLSNILVCVTVLKSKFLHDITHYLILNLAVSDGLCCFMFAINTLLDLLNYPDAISSEIGKRVYCHLMHSDYLFHSFAYISAYSLVLVALERFVGIVYPLRYVCICTKRVIWFSVCLAWVMGLCAYMIHLVGVRYEPSGVTYNDRCVLNYHSWQWHFLPFIVGFVLPLIVMLWAYVRIIRTLKQSSRNRDTMAQVLESRTATKRVIHLMLIVTITYGILYIPTQPAYMITIIIYQQHAEFGMLLTDLLSKVPVLFNSIINPFIYAYKYKKFRKGLRNMACRWCRNSINVDDSVRYDRQNSGPALTFRLQNIESQHGHPSVKQTIQAKIET